MHLFPKKNYFPKLHLKPIRNQIKSFFFVLVVACQFSADVHASIAGSGNSWSAFTIGASDLRLTI